MIVSMIMQPPLGADDASGSTMRPMARVDIRSKKHKVRTAAWGAVVMVVAMAAASVGHAEPFRKGQCQIDVPAGWVASKTRISRPDKKVWANVLQVPSTADAVQMELSMKAEKVAEDPRQIMLVSTASFGGLTNRQYHVVTKTSPACLADVTAPAGADEELAKSVAHTVTLAK